MVLTLPDTPCGSEPTLCASYDPGRQAGKAVVMLPLGWRVVDIGSQWTVQASRKSGWHPVAYHIDREAMVRQLRERLRGARRRNPDGTFKLLSDGTLPVLPDDVLATLRALPASHPGEGKVGKAEAADEGFSARSADDAYRLKQGAA
jgi:hypothetical protein